MDRLYVNGKTLRGSPEPDLEAPQSRQTLVLSGRSAECWELLGGVKKHHVGGCRQSVPKINRILLEAE
jgi:hypothetical protein